MRILAMDDSNSKERAKEVLHALQRGGLIVLPSDSVYGLCVDAENEQAVKKLIEFKSRPAGKPISIFVGNMNIARSYVEIDEHNKKTLEQILPGPYTIVLPSKHKAVVLLESEKGTLGIRIPQHSFVNSIVEKYERAITATSANLAGRSPHYSIDALLKTLSEKKKSLIDLVIDAGKLPHNPTSTVIDFTEEHISILRQGAATPESMSIESYISRSDEETRRIGQEILKWTLQKAKGVPIVILLYGEMGTGKTVFVKGVGDFLGIRNIISPTFVIYYEYMTKHSEVKKLIHCDLYKISDDEEFEHLGIQQMLEAKAVMCIEWSEKSKAIKKLFKEKGYIIEVSIEYVSESERKILIHKNI